MNANSPIDALYAKALEAHDDKDLAARLQRLDRAILQDALAIPLYQAELMYGMKKNVRFKPGLNDLPLNFKQCGMQ